MYDLIIIGAGPAGITASIYAVRKKMYFTVLTSDVGGQTLWTSNIENYTGYLFLTGQELVEKFRDHLKNIEVREGERVLSLKKEGDAFRIITTKREYLSRTALISSGKMPRRLGIPGEEEFRNKGVAYCATCDAPLFADMTVAVAGGGNSALDAALQLEHIARKVYVINIEPQFRGDPVMAEKVENLMFQNMQKIQVLLQIAK
jgi:alkyl hydroperoxide reductase subunit F